MRDPRAQLLRAALAFVSLEPREPELSLLHHRWLERGPGSGEFEAACRWKSLWSGRRFAA
jgi:hypothetical protein